WPLQRNGEPPRRRRDRTSLLVPEGVSPVSRSTQLPQSRRDRRAAARQERPAPQRHRRRTGGAPVWRSPIALVTVSAIVLGAALVFLALPKPSGHAGELISPPGEYPAGVTRGDVIGSATA